MSAFTHAAAAHHPHRTPRKEASAMKLSHAFTLAALALACVVATSAAAKEASSASAGKHLLRYRFAMGEVLRYQVKHATNVRTTIDGTSQTAISHSDSVKAWKVTDVLPNGEIEFIHLVESVRMSNETPGSPERSYDSVKDKTPPPGFEAAARAIGVPLTVIRIKPNGKIESREQKLPQQASAEDMPITLELPEQAIAVGEKWSHAYDVVAERKGGAKMQVRTRRLCRLREVKAGVAVIEVGYEILTPVDPYIRSQLVERLTTGSVRFDIERGRVVQQQHNVDRRVLGFAGKSSSMHFVAKLSERLLEAAAQVAEVQQASATE
jgi:hypothetical protein